MFFVLPFSLIFGNQKSNLLVLALKILFKIAIWNLNTIDLFFEEMLIPPFLLIEILDFFFSFGFLGKSSLSLEQSALQIVSALVIGFFCQCGRFFLLRWQQWHLPVQLQVQHWFLRLEGTSKIQCVAVWAWYWRSMRVLWTQFCGLVLYAVQLSLYVVKEWSAWLFSTFSCYLIHSHTPCVGFKGEWRWWDLSVLFHF